MIRKSLCLLAFGALILTASCKDDAASKIDETNLKASEEREAQSGKFPVVEFAEKEHDFGTINEGDKVETVFKVKNIGDADLLIIDAKGSCGCTVPEFQKTPIKPGETTDMKVSFDSNGKPGQQQKSVTLTTNTASGTEQVIIKATVTPKAGGIGVATPAASNTTK